MPKTLTLMQCSSMLTAIETRGTKRAKASDLALFTSLILCGADARVWTWQDIVETFLVMPYAAYKSIRDMAIDKKLAIFPFNHSHFTAAHWVRGTKIQHAVFSVGATPLTTQEVTRRMKRYARLAGIPSELMSLRTISNTSHLLRELYGDADAVADALGMVTVPGIARTPTAGILPRGSTPSVQWFPGQGTRVDRDPRLHGVGRRRSTRPA